MHTKRNKKLHIKLRRKKLVYGNFSLFKLLMFWFFRGRREYLWVTFKIKKTKQAISLKTKTKTHWHTHTQKRRKKRGGKEKKWKRNEQKALKICHVSHRNYPTKIVTAADEDVLSCVLQLSSWCQKIRHNLNGPQCGMCWINPVMIIENRPVS